MTESTKVLTMAALGRPFHLGSLYDIRNEQIISGVTLWDKADLDNVTHVQKFGTSDIHYITTNSLSDSISALDISGSLKLSLLGGLVDLSGAARFLENRNMSGRQQRVVLQYKCTTRAEELTMERLGHGCITHPQVFEQGSATHVVTGIEYGAHAFFVFDRTYSSSDSKNAKSCKLEAMIKKIPKVSVDIEASYSSSSQQEEMDENINCRFFGDFYLPENISSYQDAVRTYTELPKLLGRDGENAVPVKVRLFPLVLLDSKASRLVQEISNHLISDTENTLETLFELQVHCNDLLESDIGKRLMKVSQDVSEFASLIVDYKYNFQGELFSLLPAIRGGGKEESRLAELLEKKESSPFSTFSLLAWVYKKKAQLKIFNEYLMFLSEIHFASTLGDFEKVIMSPSNKLVLCLVIYFPRLKFQLVGMRKCLRRAKADEKSHEDKVDTSMTPGQHYCNMNMSMKIRSFKMFANCNKSETATKFIVMEEGSDVEEFSASVLYYKDGQCKSKDYQLPSTPGRVMVDEDDTWHDHVTVRWSPPEHGAATTQQYCVAFKEVESTGQGARTVWSDTCHATLCGLVPNTRYQVSVQAWCEVGYGPHSDVISDVCTRPASPPGVPTVHLTSPTTVHIRWSPPQLLGSPCSIKSYSIRQRKGMESEEWISITNQAEDKCSWTATISPNSPLIFSVAANCNPAGQTCHSQPNDGIAGAGNPASTKLKEAMIQVSTLLKVGPPCIYQLRLQLTVNRTEDVMARYELGQRCGATEKVILLLGETGAGKTTFLNALVNYIFGVTWDDPFRFMLTTEPNSSNQSKSQTAHTTAYSLHYQDGFLVPFTLTFIDTPGFGSIEGVPRDHEIMANMKRYFTSRGNGSIDYLNTIGFVVPATQNRLTRTQQYICDQIRSIFGSDIAGNILLLFTFADGKKPQSLNIMKKAKIPFKKYYKFNNSFLTMADNDNEDEDEDEEVDYDFNRHFWNMGEHSYKQFLNNVTQIPARLSPSLRQ